jgi:hypothetical protein
MGTDLRSPPSTTSPDDAAAIVSQRVVNIGAARRVLRKVQTPQRVAPDPSVSNLALAVLLAALSEEKPKLGGAVIRRLLAAERVAEDRGDRAGAALQFVWELRAGARQRTRRT